MNDIRPDNLRQFTLRVFHKSSNVAGETCSDARMASEGAPRYGEKTPPLHVGRGPVPRHAPVYRKIARDRPSRYGIGTASGPSDVREGQALALRGRRFPCHRRAGACPPPCCALPKPREGQALALRYRDGDWALGRSRGTGPRATG